jgi:tetratricopeptide (TPR) repeat protein
MIVFLSGSMLIPGQSLSQSPFHDSIDRVLPRIKDKTEQVSFYNRMAEGLLNDDTALARKMALAGLMLAQEMGNQYEIAKTHFILGKIAIFENKLDAAQNHLCEARDITRNSAHKQLCADVLEQQCLLYEIQGEYEEARRLAREMIPIRINTNEMSKIPSSYLILGNILQLTGKYDSAIFYFNEALSLYEHNHNATGKAKVLNNIGNVHYYLGNYDTAIQYYLKSLQIKVEQNDTVAQSKTLNNIAAIYYQTGNLPKSLQYYRNCMSLSHSMGHEPHLAIGYGNIGLVFYDMKKYDSAMQYYSKALALYQKHKMVKGIAATLTNIGLLKYDLSQYHEALSDFKSALALNREIRDESETALTLQHMASTWLAIGRTDQALRFALQSFEICQKYGLKKQQMDVNNLLARIYSENGHYKQALIHLNAFIKIKDSLFSNEQREELNRIVEKYEMERKEKQINLLKTEKKNIELELQKRDLIVYGIAVIFLLVAIIASLLFNRFRIKRNQLQISMEIKMNEVEQRLVQSKLNPHAISNALRTIEKMILNQDTGQASLHLKRFESYVRHLLDKSVGSMITLRQEIAFLQLYLDMEMDFAPGKFKGNISVSPDLLPDEIEIPPMFIQPYVENAIKHGVKHLVGPGLIDIAFSKKNNHLVCTVTDNGIGRKASANLYRNKRELYPSVGSGLLEERRSLLKKLGRIDIDLETTDLSDINGNALGTMVAIRFELDE